MAYPVVHATPSAPPLLSTAIYITVDDHKLLIPKHQLPFCKKIIAFTEAFNTNEYPLDCKFQEAVKLISYLNDDPSLTATPANMPCKLLSDIGADELIFLNSLKHIKLIRSTNNILVLVNNAANILDKEKLVCVIQQDSKYWAPGTTADDYKNFTICKTNILTFFIAANQLKKYESKCITSKGPLTDSRATKIGECYTLTNDLCMGEAYYIIRNSEIYPKYKFVCIFTRSSEIMAYFSDQLYTPPYYLQALIIKNDLPLTFSTMRKSINFIS